MHRFSRLVFKCQADDPPLNRLAVFLQRQCDRSCSLLPTLRCLIVALTVSSQAGLRRDQSLSTSFKHWLALCSGLVRTIYKLGGLNLLYVRQLGWKEAKPARKVAKRSKIRSMELARVDPFACSHFCSNKQRNNTEMRRQPSSIAEPSPLVAVRSLKWNWYLEAGCDLHLIFKAGHVVGRELAMCKRWPASPEFRAVLLSTDSGSWVLSGKGLNDHTVHFCVRRRSSHARAFGLGLGVL